MWGIFKKFEKEKQKVKEKISTKSNKENDLNMSIKKLERREVKEIDTSLLSKNFKIDYNNLLNKEQKKALFSLQGQYLVIAGAGSGKTRTIVYRTAWLIENGIESEKILMITFTRKASEEMKERLENLFEGREIKTNITTFHSFCAKLIYKYRNIFNLGNFEIIEEDEREKLFKHFIEKFEFQKKYKGKFYSVDTILNNFSKIKNGNLKIEDIFKEQDKIKDILLLKSEYNKYKKERKIYEYDDLIKLVVRKLQENNEFLKVIKEKFEYIVVDEYQDSNSEQRKLLKLLVGENGNLMVVGDDYQSIYGFRGADFTNILKFGDDFPKAQLIKLEQNYRSSDEIIRYTNRIAKNFKLKYNKKIFGLGRNQERIHINSFKNIEEEGRYICEKIISYKESIPYEDMAILYRNRYTIVVLEKLLQEYKIPYHKKSEENKKGISLYTIHSSKGLEWELVFVPTLLDGIFPSNLVDENLEEEKRLYYVACSRAKTYLYLTYPKFYYEKLGYFDKKSKFLNY
ncbi:ATP-dependent helicase [uncultured Fusobacterium sp.]|uniref:ATP-dependent helicase n=1 Tax=uncultured Fusobacterium sp. TaxID=159267 RepID=UPI0025CE300E|nr:ATP-dependent helicase [uncultured Fusobacterium sp.]